MKTILIALFYYIWVSSAEDVYTAVYNYNKEIIANNSANKNVTLLCRDQLQQYALGLENYRSWALFMFDAKAKAPSGIYSQNYYHFGNFDECLNVHFQNIRGKYCLGSGGNEFGQAMLVPLGHNQKLTGLHVGVCIPDQCTASDVSQIYPSQNFFDEFCYTDFETQLSTEAIVALAILGLFFGISIVSTIYDTYLYYSDSKLSSRLAATFSYLSNGSKLFSFKTTSELSCLEGFKALSVMWIVLGHTYVFQANASIFHFGNLIEFFKNGQNMWIITSDLGVDTFFVIGGLLTVYTAYMSLDKGIKFNPTLFYIHRYLRLTPVLAVVILVHVSLLKYFGSGPLWYGVEKHLMDSCRSLWWWALLHIQNYSNERIVCVPQSWYLSVDVQMFLLSPLFFLPMRKWPKKTIITMAVLILGGCGVSFALAHANQLRGLLIMNGDEYYLRYYYQTYARFGPYLVGMILGYYIHQIKTEKRTLNMHWIQAMLIWTICLAVCLTCLYVGKTLPGVNQKYDRWPHSLYIAFNRTTWSLGISGIILACVTGYGGPVNSFLSCAFFQFVSKLSYSIYLIHYGLIICIYLSSKSVKTFGPVEMVSTFFSVFTVSLFLAIILYLTVEVPFANLEKIILGKIKIENKFNKELILTKQKPLSIKF